MGYRYLAKEERPDVEEGLTIKMEFFLLFLCITYVKIERVIMQTMKCSVIMI